jgi:hypothetical protein
MLENWLLPQLNTSYDEYILQLDGAPAISTRMYERFSIVFFHSAGSDVLLMETTFSLGHPARRTLHHAISLCVGSCAAIAQPIQERRDRITHALQAITALQQFTVICHREPVRQSREAVSLLNTECVIMCVLTVH